MIQRIQSVYMLISLLLILIPTLLGNGLSSFLPQTEMNLGLIISQSLTFIVPLINIPLIIIALLFYKKQNVQSKLLLITLAVSVFGVIGFFTYYQLGNSYPDPLSENWIKAIPIIISIPFLLLAIKAIKKDINLLKSVDRIR